MNLETKAKVFLPGSTVGVMGGGQLGRMFAIAARRMGYRVHSFSPGADTPTGQLADLEMTAEYDDEARVRTFARCVDVLTFEFENIPSTTIAWCAQETVVRPAGRVLHTCQHRLREKTFLRDGGFPLPKFVEVRSEPELRDAVAALGEQCVLKSASFGYDGKGQVKIGAGSDLATVWGGFQTDGVVEEWVPFAKEISVLVARGIDSEVRSYPVCENRHANHILDLTLVPAEVAPEAAAAARDLAERVAAALDLVGLLAVEMFLLSDGRILINELAPRPHNSGHYSFDASITGQFEQQLRAVCGLPLGSTETLRPCAMANLLGELWDGGEPRWAKAAAFPEVKIHLYGKSVPRAGRKMGHLVAFGSDPHEAAERVLAARAALRGE